jgi:hypothetical protein
MSDRLIIRLLAVCCVLLAAIAIASAVLAGRAHKQMACWRDFAQDHEAPPEGDCDRVR